MSSEARETLGASKPTRPELDQGQDLGKRLPGASSIDDFFEQSRAARLAEGPRTPGAGSGSDPRDTIGILQENRRINLVEYGPLSRSFMFALAFAIGAVASAGGIYFFQSMNARHPPPPSAIAAMPPLPPQSATVVAPPPSPSAVAPQAPTLQPSPVEALPAASIALKPAVPMPDQAKLSLPEIVEVQTRLESLGMSPGAWDGVWGPHTAAAIRRYEESKGEPQIGKLDRELLERLRQELADALHLP